MNNPVPYFLYAVQLYTGNKVQKNFELAGEMLEKGDGLLKRSGDKANLVAALVPMCRETAQQGRSRGQLAWGMLNWHGLGVTKNGKDAFNWVRKSASSGSIWAQFALGVIYEKGEPSSGLRKDEWEASRWYRKAGTSGLVLAQMELAERYKMGKGVSKSKEESLKWYKMAAKQGYKPAQEELKTLEWNGELTEEDMNYYLKSTGDFIYDSSWNYFTVWPAWSNSKLGTASESMKIPSHETIFMLYDSTLWGGNKNGAALGRLGLYGKFTLSNPVFISWKEFTMSNTIKVDGASVIIAGKDLYFNFGADDKRDREVKRLRDFQTYLRKKYR